MKYLYNCLFLDVLSTPLTFVSFLGVLPLWVIPAKALGTAPSAPADDNLKYLLAFAGAHLVVLLDLFVIVCLWLFFPSLVWNPFYSWRLTWRCFSSPSPRNVSTCKGNFFPVTSSFLTTNKIDVCAGNWIWWRGWLVQNWCCHSHRSSRLPRPWEGLSEKLKSAPLSFSWKTTWQTSSSPRCWRWATPRRTRSSARRRTRRSSATSTCSPIARTTYCMGLRYNCNRHNGSPLSSGLPKLANCKDALLHELGVDLSNFEKLIQIFRLAALFFLPHDWESQPQLPYFYMRWKQMEFLF